MLSWIKLRYCKHVICQTCMSDIRRQTSYDRRQTSVVRGCVPVSASSSLIYHFWFLKHHHSASTHHHRRRCEMQLSYPWKLHACRAINIYFLCIFIFCSMYLVLFSIVLYRTIVTVYTDNICQYNYIWQSHKIIYLSPVGCFTPARDKTI